MHDSNTAPRAERRPYVWTSRQWIEYFRANDQRQPILNWDAGHGATTAELENIWRSLQGWQLGETSDGSHLIKAATSYALRIGDADFLDAARLFIREEQRHGSHLGRYLEVANVGTVKSNWGDTLFRLARHSIPRMEVWATPVVMVETHAMVYYNAIRRATRSPLLRAICRQILIDEVPHIRFQCERLAILHRRRPRVLRALTMAFQRVMFAGVTIAIWVGHRRALRAGGYTFGRFWRTVWGRMHTAWRMMEPRRYEWPVEKRPRGEVMARPAIAATVCATDNASEPRRI